MRAQVRQGTAVVFGASAQLGPAWLNRGLGIESHFAFIISGGVEFSL